MSRRDREREGGRPGLATQWLPVVLVLVLLAGAVAAHRFDLGARWSADEPDPVQEPAAVPPPEGLELHALDRPGPVAADPAGGRLDRATVGRVLTRGLRDPDLGRSVHGAVADLDGGALAWEQGGRPFTPASTTKLPTALAALETLGPDHRFATAVVGRGDTVTLVGGGDPLLARAPDEPAEWPARADVVTLARQTAASLRQDGRRRVRLRYDTGLFSGSAENPWWRADYLPDDIVSPVTALWVDEGLDPDGLGRLDDPARGAAGAFAAALQRQGITVTGPVRQGRAPRDATELASVSSAPLASVVEQVLAVSDNEGAEVLARHVALATGEEPSFAGASRAVTATLRDLGVPMSGVVLHDGSGLARGNRLTARALLEVLRLAAEPRRPDLRAVVTGLPVGGFTGSLAYRFDTAPRAGVGRVRAKTGTLRGVSSLAGIATDLEGTPMAFVLAADRVRRPDSLDARQSLDDLAGALGACRCTR